MKYRARFFRGITLEQKTWISVRGVLVEGALRLRMLRLSNRTFPGPVAGRALAHRTIRSQAVLSCLGSTYRICVSDGHAAEGVVSFRK
jgi:hypothetical protein